MRGARATKDPSACCAALLFQHCAHRVAACAHTRSLPLSLARTLPPLSHPPSLPPSSPFSSLSLPPSSKFRSLPLFRSLSPPAHLPLPLTGGDLSHIARHGKVVVAQVRVDVRQVSAVSIIKAFATLHMARVGHALVNARICVRQILVMVERRLLQDRLGT